MKSYKKWDQWASEYDDDGNNKKEMKDMMQNFKCEIGKPLTKEEFENRNDKDDTNIKTVKMN